MPSGLGLGQRRAGSRQLERERRRPSAGPRTRRSSGPLFGEPLHEVADGLEAAPVQRLAAELAQVGGGSALGRAGRAGWPGTGSGRRRVAEEPLQGGLEVEPHARLAGRRRGAEPVAQQVADRPVREALGVGEARPSSKRSGRRTAPTRLGDQARLADARLAGERDDHADAVGQPLDARRAAPRARRRGRPAARRRAGRVALALADDAVAVDRARAARAARRRPSSSSSKQSAHLAAVSGPSDDVGLGRRAPAAGR